MFALERVIRDLTRSSEQLEALGYEKMALQISFFIHDLQLKLHGDLPDKAEFPEHFE